jgi:hypothetical protein
MNFSPSRLIVMLAVAAAVVAAPAQQQQTIVFSKPADVPAEKAKSYLPTITYHVSDFNAPHLLFNNAMPDPPAPRPQVNNYNNAEAQDALNRRRNWTLLTPEAILGIQTPEQILGLPDKNAGDKKLSLEEQFLQRENKAFSESHSKDHPGGPAWHAMDEADALAAKEKPEEDSPFRQSQPKTEPGSKFFNGFLNASGPSARPDENQGSTWNTAFTQPTQPKPTTEQQADMERFRALMEPTPPPEQPQAPTRFVAAPAPAPDPFLQAMPVVNPAGRGFAPLENSLSRPSGLQPLPGISTPAPQPAAVRPSWQAQPPPWMQSGQPAKPNWSY